jgi:hypothetical protein
MARTRNLLSNADALMRVSTQNNAIIAINEVPHNWTATNATVAIIGREFVVDTRYVLELSPSSLAPIVLELAAIPLNIADNDRILSANIKLKALSPMSVSGLLFIDEDDNNTAVQETLTSGLYNAVHTNTVVVPNDGQLHTATIRITIENHNAATIHVTLPHLIHDFAFYENPFVGRMRNFLPDFYFEIDSAQEAPTYPYFRLIDILTSAAGETAIEHDLMYGVEQAQLDSPYDSMFNWAQSSLVSPRSVRGPYTPWLSQFTGTALKQNIEYADGSVFFQNESARRDFIEWQLRYSFYGRAAGTRRAMVEAARQVLIYTKDGEPTTLSVAVTPRYLDDLFTIKVQTLTNETPDADAGEESHVVLQSVNWAKPMGYKVVHETVDEFFFSFDDPTLGVLDSMRFG